MINQFDREWDLGGKYTRILVIELCKLGVPKEIIHETLKVDGRTRWALFTDIYRILRGCKPKSYDSVKYTEDKIDLGKAIYSCIS